MDVPVYASEHVITADQAESWAADWVTWFEPLLAACHALAETMAAAFPDGLPEQIVEMAGLSPDAGTGLLGEWEEDPGICWACDWRPVPEDDRLGVCAPCRAARL